MNKYLLRGFGVGCVFAAVLLFFINKPKPVTDDEIISKAKSLGMVTSEELEEKLKEERLNAIKESLNRDSEDSKEQPVAEAEPVAENEPEKKPGETPEEPEEPVEPVEEPTEEPVEEIEPAEEPAEEPVEEQVEEPAEEPAEEIEPAKETPEEPAEDDNNDDVDNPFDVYYKLTISRGMSSEKVSAALEAAGVIGSASDFNSYLVRNGKSSVINVGVFDIPYDSDYDVIADIITK